MTRRAHGASRTAGLAMALGLCVCSVGARAQEETADPDIRDIRPVVMLLVDTSGSMERMSGGAGADLPMCAGSVAGTNERNRWTTVVEALTGTWSDTDYYCSAIDRGAYTGFEDFNYYLPYHQPPLAIAQNEDGVLDAYLERIKFGLMTFDATYTFINGHPLLVERPAFEARHPGQNHANWGGYSYGDPQTLMFAGCPDEFMVDSGSRNEDAPAGALISVGLETDDYRLINQTIQTQIRNVRPYGGTPIAAMLTDLEHYLDQHPDVSTDDPFQACRSRVAILLTDGQPDADFRDARFDCESVDGCPYSLSRDVADRLCGYSDASRTCTGDLDGLFVVAFDVDDTAAVDELNAIADAGGTEAALQAGDRAALVARLAEAIDRAAPGNTTRSRPAFVTGGSTFGSGTAPTQLEFNAGFRVGQDGAPWSGILERTRYLCNAENEPEPEDVADRVRFDQVLNTNDARTLYTVVTADPSDMDGNLVGDQATGFTLNATSAPGVVTDVVRGNLADLDPEHLGIPAGEITRAEEVLDWVRGTSTTEERMAARMGDIYHSSPVAVSAPRIDIADESYNLFRELPAVADRPTVVYVGTNDGILHAFAAEDWTSAIDGDAYEAGDEIWGFVPPILAPALESATVSHQILLDGTPVVKDVFFARSPGDQPAANSFHTVLVMGFRGGSRGYFALDVTDPTEPQFLWQFVGEPDSGGGTPMGDSYGVPALGQILVEIDGVLQERGVAVLPGGAGELDEATALANGDDGCAAAVEIPTAVGTTGPRPNVRCWRSRGRVLTFLDVGTGQILRVFDETEINAPLTGGVALYPGDVGTVAQRAFVTDADGVIWSANMRLRDPEEWTITGLHDIFWDAGATVGQPGYAPPTVSSDEQGQLVVVQATGDIDRLDSVDFNRVVSVTEVVAFSTAGEPTFSSDLNWEVRLLEGEQVTGPLELFEGTIYFATFESASDPDNLCALGQSRIWGVDYLEAGGTAPDPYEDTLGGFFPQPHYADGLGGFDHFNGPLADRLVLGVGITQRPTCVTGDTIPDPFIGTRFVVSNVGGGQFQLTAQMSGGSSTDDAAIQTITQALPTPPSSTTVHAFAGQVDY